MRMRRAGWWVAVLVLTAATALGAAPASAQTSTLNPFQPKQGTTPPQGAPSTGTPVAGAPAAAQPSQPPPFASRTAPPVASIATTGSDADRVVPIGLALATAGAALLLAVRRQQARVAQPG